ncbi:MAG: hypothetical protein ACREDE_09585 [Thermoplasmata archaeon]
MPTLFVRCKSCGTEFPTPIGEPEKGRSGAIITGLSLHCPHCRREDVYSTADFHLPRIVDGPPEGRGAEAEENLSTEAEAKRRAKLANISGAGVVDPSSQPRSGG